MFAAGLDEPLPVHDHVGARRAPAAVSAGSDGLVVTAERGGVIRRRRSVGSRGAQRSRAPNWRGSDSASCGTTGATLALRLERTPS